LDDIAVELPAQRTRLAPGARVVVTGAGGYSGRVLARALLEAGVAVTNLTGHPERETPFGDKITSARMDFARPGELERAMRGASVFFNTYWVRFPYRGKTHPQAVANSILLFEAAKRAGVARIVHTSIANPALDSPLSYYRGKAQVERALQALGVSHAILRPTVFFGEQDVLVNNIAWFVRRFPLFLVPGDGRYRVQPMHVADFASLMAAAAESNENLVADGVGPEVYTFEELVRLIAGSLERRVALVHAPRLAVHAATSLFSLFLRDVLLTRAEIDGLMADLLVSHGAPTGTTKLSEWLRRNSAQSGSRYASEVARHYR
jgi:NADH dehydrogenase